MLVKPSCAAAVELNAPLVTPRLPRPFAGLKEELATTYVNVSAPAPPAPVTNSREPPTDGAADRPPNVIVNPS